MQGLSAALILLSTPVRGQASASRGKGELGLFLSSYFTSFPGCNHTHHTCQLRISPYRPRGFAHYSLNPGIMRFLSKVTLGLIFREHAEVCANSVPCQEPEPPPAGLSLGGF